MTSLHHRDHDLHNKAGEHLTKPPRNHPDPDAWHARLRRHEMAHHMNLKAPPRPSTARTPRRRPRATMDPWLADMTDRVNTRLGPRIRDLLREHEVIQQQLADDLGISLSALSDRLHCRKPFTLPEGMFLVEYFGVPIEELLADS